MEATKSSREKKGRRDTYMHKTYYHYHCRFSHTVIKIVYSIISDLSDVAYDIYSAIPSTTLKN